MQTNNRALVGDSLVHNYTVISAMFVVPLLLEITRPPLLWFSLLRKLSLLQAPCQKMKRKLWTGERGEEEEEEERERDREKKTGDG